MTNFRTLALVAVAFSALSATAAKAELCSDGTIIRHENAYERAKAKETCDLKHGGTAYTCIDGKECYPAGGPIRANVHYCTRSTPPAGGRTGVPQCR